jgi:hypothetical protein
LNGGDHELVLGARDAGCVVDYGVVVCENAAAVPC